MRKYLLKRILFSLFALVAVTGTVMTLIYTLMKRETILQTDEAYKKQLGADKQNYKYRIFYEYGYIYYTEFQTWLRKNADPSSQEYLDALAAVQVQKTPDSVVYPENELCHKFVEEYQAKGYTVEWLKPYINRKGYLEGTGGFFVATKEKNIFERLGDYFSNFFQIDTIWSVQDETLTDRYVRWEWDPYSNMPALVGNGSKHRYLIYFDDQFPFVHQNIITIQMGRSSVYSGTDAADLLLRRTGDPVIREDILPKDIYEENPTPAKTDRDFHTVTYSEVLTPSTEAVYGVGNHYTNAIQKKDGLMRVGHSFILGIIATVAAYLLGLPIGIWMARKRDKLVDHIGNAYIIFIIAVPSLAYIYMFAAIGIRLFSLPWKWQLSDSTVLASILPIVSLTLPSVGGLMRWIRRFMVDQENSDYVKFARSQGLTEREVFSKHIFRNALIFIIHSVPANILTCLVGAIITERVYGVPGVGGLLTDAIPAHDNGIIVGATVFYTFLSIVSFILGDLLLAKYDPRVSFTNERG